GVLVGSVNSQSAGRRRRADRPFPRRARRLSVAAVRSSSPRPLRVSITPAPSDAELRLAAIRDRIAAAARAAGRRPAAVALVAVSKQQPWANIEPILTAGQSTFGENRVQEAEKRWADRHAGLELRLIGPLQTNKVTDAAELFDVIETLDRPK